MTLAGRKILITGAASGIGAATARLFSNEGASLALLDRAWSPDHPFLSPAGATERAIECDLRDEDSVTSAVETANYVLNGLDGVVNCAGISLRKSVEDTSPSEWDELMDVNLRGPYLICRAVAPILKAQERATIVNVSSGAAFRPSFDFSAYCASKGGLLMFTRAIALDFAPFGVRVNAVCPGVVDTPMIERAIARSPDPKAAEARFQSNAMARMGHPEELSQVILFLTSDASSFVTGSAYSADGGAGYH